MTDYNVTIKLHGDLNIPSAKRLQRGDIMNIRPTNAAYGTKEHRSQHKGPPETWHGVTGVLTLTDVDMKQMRSLDKTRTDKNDPEIVLRKSDYNLDLENLPDAVLAGLTRGTATMPFQEFLAYLTKPD
jgi:hypothetical protein